MGGPVEETVEEGGEIVLGLVEATAEGGVGLGEDYLGRSVVLPQFVREVVSTAMIRAAGSPLLATSPIMIPNLLGQNSERRSAHWSWMRGEQ